MTSDVIDRYLADRGTLSDTSLNIYNIILNKFDEEYDLLEAERRDVSAFISSGDYALKTKKDYRNILRKFYEWAEENELIENNPASNITIKSGRVTKREIVSEKDFREIIQRCEGLRETTLFSFLWYTGVRASELCNIRIEDINLDTGYVFISKSKTKAGYREIPIHKNFEPLLRLYLSKRDDLDTDKPWVFLTKYGKKYKYRNLLVEIKKKTDKFALHAFRRAFITRLYRITNDLMKCQRFAGHESVETTRKYIIDDLEQQKNEFNAIDF